MFRRGCLSSFILLAALSAVSVPVHAYQTSRFDYAGQLQMPSEDPDGSWKSRYYCNDGEYAIGALVVWETDCGPSCDDTGLNDIRLRCSPRSAWDSESSELLRSDSPNHYGNDRSTQYCNSGEFITGFNAKADPDLGLSNVTFTCSDNQTLTFPVSLDLGTWGGNTSCSAGQLVCGERIHYTDPSGPFGNEKALSAARMACCTDIVPGELLRFGVD